MGIRSCVLSHIRDAQVSYFKKGWFPMMSGCIGLFRCLDVQQSSQGQEAWLNLGQHIVIPYIRKRSSSWTKFSWATEVNILFILLTWTYTQTGAVRSIPRRRTERGRCKLTLSDFNVYKGAFIKGGYRPHDSLDSKLWNAVKLLARSSNQVGNIHLLQIYWKGWCKEQLQL